MFLNEPFHVWSGVKENAFTLSYSGDIEITLTLIITIVVEPRIQCDDNGHNKVALADSEGDKIGWSVTVTLALGSSTSVCIDGKPFSEGDDEMDDWE